MVLARITDLFTGQSIEINQCPDCNYVHTGNGCPQCEEVFDLHANPWGTDLSPEEETRELLSWEAYYRRH
jgi:hypothetical protein